VALAQWDGPRGAIVPYFIALRLALVLNNEWLAQRIMALRHEPARALEYEGRFAFGLGAAGAAWGLIGWMVPDMDLAHWGARDLFSVLILVYVSCMMLITAAHCPRGLVFHIVALWSVAIGQAALQTEALHEGLVIIVAVLGLLVTTGVYGRMLVNQTRSGVRAELEREDLTESLRWANIELERALQQAVDAASHDPLTGVLNRRALYGHAEHVAADRRRRERPCALLLLDLDHFKRINDRHGHGAGDAVLGAVAATLGRELREVDLIARWGGEEFLVLMPDCNTESALVRAEQLRAQVAALVLDVLPTGYLVSVSIGAADWDNGEAIDDAIKRADGALYRAKGEGRDRVVLAAAA
jgi:diguanylate cyclase (GGDEF)-like protein